MEIQLDLIGKGTVAELAIRHRRICENKEEYQKHRKAVMDGMDREELLRKRKNNEKANSRTPLVTTYTKDLPNLHNIVRKNMKVLHQSERMQTIFREPPIIAYRRDRNLGDILVHGKLNKAWDDKSLCDSEKCEVCNKIPAEGKITSTDGKRTFNVRIIKERDWMKRLRTEHPNGLNKKCSVAFL
ncbi:hypothetical protein LOTGIDRAFT_176268 [Lottia gigantea]|uniref:Uncharacterized protein n=1 Tax=Lottia gigantea TaxID=225164 RepID=V3ZFW8_LOTGI|nr:hypothetical protein LOTGIDRAFT_176268 [Lottia gigantea]ESO83022.1 hypothetical protein LOTGIDRAFT_176268 [Lottia gigantea]